MSMNQNIENAANSGTNRDVTSDMTVICVLMDSPIEYRDLPIT